MSSWDDIEVDTDGDELLDWLLDIPDRYDTGIEDPPAATIGSRSGARKHLRTPGEAPPFGGPPPGVDDRPTIAIQSYDAPDYDEYRTAPVPIVYGGERARRFTTGSLLTALIVLLTVAAGIGVGYLVLGSSGKKGKPSKLDVTSPTTASGFTPGTASVAATTSTSSSTTSVPDTSTSVPVVIVIPSTTTTVPHTTTTRPTTTTTKPKTTTTTTSSTTTTTTTTVPATTTSTTSSTTSTSTTSTTSTTSSTTMPMAPTP